MAYKIGIRQSSFGAWKEIGKRSGDKGQNGNPTKNKQGSDPFQWMWQPVRRKG